MLALAINKNTLALKKKVFLAFIVFWSMQYNAVAITGSGDSPATLLDTVSPALQSAEAVTDNGVVVTFSEAMLMPGAVTPGNYAATGPGSGTLGLSPSGVSGGPFSFTLDWATSEMRDGSLLTLTASGVQDAVGNLINPVLNEASFPGKGTGPVFSGVTAIPPQACLGNLVVLKFAVSEKLIGAPKVAVNGSRAAFVGADINNYIYQYTIKRDDLPGLAAIQLSGEDLAGNPGTSVDDTALEIITNPQGMPVYWLPAVLMLPAAGVLFLCCCNSRTNAGSKKRFLFFLLCLASVLTCAPAFAQTPAVTNVSMGQSANGVLGTRVDIYYDLTANAPCDVVLSLSKDAGADGYPHAVRYYSGDIANVEPGTNRHIVWDIRADYPEETLPEASIRVTADDENIVYTLQYAAGEHGYIIGATVQTLNHGEDGETVTAAPDEGYHFVSWSDGVTTSSRQDSGVTGSLAVTASFAINTHTITCIAEGSGLCFADPAVVNHGGSSAITISPAAGWYIDSVVDSEEGPKTGSYTTTPLMADRTVTATFATGLIISSFSINTGAEATGDILVTLDNSCTGTPAEYLASESEAFTGAAWQPYAAAPAFSLSPGVGPRTVYFKVRNGGGESALASDVIFLEPKMLPVTAGTFAMGRTDIGDDAFYGAYSELPVHPVTLDAYEVAKYQTTNKQFCDVLNWALAQGYLKTFNGLPWTGTGDICGGGNLQILVAMLEPECNVEFTDGLFIPRTRTGVPDGTVYAMDAHPMVRTSWFGHAAFCNWLSEWQGVTPCYDMDSVNWPLTTPPPQSGGYRLPTEAEWERAAAWDGSRHWIYGYTNDTLSEARCNYGNHPYGPYVNPLGLTELPYTSPVGWFDGMNISPNGNIPTLDSPSPVGAYDMSGNVWEWCQDWYSSTYYVGGAMTNPTGPATGVTKVFRGGAFRDAQNCRTASRDSREPDKTPYWRGGRVVRTP